MSSAPIYVLIPIEEYEKMDEDERESPYTDADSLVQTADFAKIFGGEGYISCTQVVVGDVTKQEKGAIEFSEHLPDDILTAEGKEVVFHRDGLKNYARVKLNALYDLIVEMPFEEYLDTGEYKIRHMVDDTSLCVYVADEAPYVQSLDWFITHGLKHCFDKNGEARFVVTEVHYAHD